MNPTVTEILALLVKEFGFPIAEALLTLLVEALANYKPEATYNNDAPHVRAIIAEWRKERGH